jgi:putative transposase
VVNVKRVRRLCVKHGLSLRHRARRKRRGLGGSVPCRAEHMNHVWTYDFVHDHCENGRKLKMLTVVDEFTRECHKVQAGTRITSRGVIGLLESCSDCMVSHGSSAATMARSSSPRRSSSG